MVLNCSHSSIISDKLTSKIMYLLFFLLFSRLISMYFMPLNDTTEARYGEIARIMLETGNWITPMQQYGIPFWAKPPLSTWLSALSMKLFGVNELAVRLPGLLLSIGVLGLIWGLANKRSNADVAKISVLVLAGSIFFLLDAGTVMTDPSLLFSITLTLVSFWRAVVGGSTLWGYLFFVAQGIGLLAKGPIAIVLPAMPIFIWVLRHNKWRELWQYLPWIKGGLITLSIALPWYVLAEVKTPGFLNYFILGENIQRFLQPGWHGDKYGFAHTAPYGMIWIYAFLGIFPWIIPCVFWLGRHGRQLPALCKDDDGWVSYLILCTIIPIVFFTFARNIIYPYVFPSLPTFALLFAELAHRSQVSLKNQYRLIPLASISGIVFLCVAIVFVVKPELVAKSQNRVVDIFKKEALTAESHLIYWGYKTDYSAQFYSAGHADSTLDAHHLCNLLSNNTRNVVVLDSDIPREFPDKILAKLNEITVIPMLHKRLRILRAENIKCSELF